MKILSVTRLAIPDVKVIRFARFGDDRGYFSEHFRQTDLASPLLAALEWAPDLVVIVSDGFDNDPPRGAGEVCRVMSKVFQVRPSGAVGARSPL